MVILSNISNKDYEESKYLQLIFGEEKDKMHWRKELKRPWIIREKIIIQLNMMKNTKKSQLICVIIIFK